MSEKTFVEILLNIAIIVMFGAILIVATSYFIEICEEKINERHREYKK